MFLGVSSSVFGVNNPEDLSVRLLGVQPLPTHKDGGDPVGGVGDLHAVQQPARTQACVVVLHLHPEQLTHVQHLQDKAVRLLALKQVSKLLPELPAARVTVGAVERDEDVGVGAGALLVRRDDDDLVLDRHQAAGLAGEALHRARALEGHELVPLGREWDLSVARKNVPEWMGGEDG